MVTAQLPPGLMRTSFSRLEHLTADDGASPDTVAVKRSVPFGTGVVEIVDYSWGRPTTYVWSCDGYFVTLPLTPRPGPAWAAYVDTRVTVKERLARAMFVPAGRTVQSGGPPGKQRSLACLLSADLFDALLPHEPVWNEASLSEGLRLSAPEVEWLLFKIYTELKQDDFGSKIIIESLVTALAVALIRRVGSGQIASVRRSGGMAPWRMRRIRERVRAELPAPNVSELAELCGMSARHLARAFKSETGQTIAQYVQEAIIERAHALLGQSDASVHEIARSLGFASTSGFSSAFRRATGMLPRDVAGRRRPRQAARKTTAASICG